MMPRIRTRLLLALLPLLYFSRPSTAQSLTQVGLRSVSGQGRFVGLRTDTAGNLYTLLEAQDGVRLVKMDAAASTVLAETHIGQAGDHGIALTLDAMGNVYVAGTSLSNGSVTGTTGTAFPNRADTTTNSFVAKFTPALSEQWLTFLGSGRMAATGVDATANQVVVTGAIFASTLPVTANGIQQQPLPNSSGGNGFVEAFGSAAGQLVYSTYLSGANGTTAPTAIAVDASDNAYVVGTTTASGFPTLNALVPRLLSDSSAPVSGFLTKLTPAGDGFVFSTFVPGSGLTSVRVDAGTNTLLVGGNLAGGLFPLTQVAAPVAALAGYQSAVRIAVDGSAVTSSTLLAPGTNTVVAPAGAGFAAAVASDSGTVPPLLPLPSSQSQGSGFLFSADSSGVVQAAGRVGGIPVNNAGFSSVPTSAGGTAAVSGGVLFAGGIAPTLSSALLPTQRFDVSLGPAVTAALPSSVRDALPPASCSGSACAGGAALLARVASNTSASLLLSVDDLPNITVRNTGSTQATGVTISATGFAVSGSSCAGTLAAGAECDVALSGNGPGSVTVMAGNAATATAALPATTLSPDPLSVVPKEVDFGITAAVTPRSRTLTITNLTAAPQTFQSVAGVTNSNFTITQAATTCAPVGDNVSYTVSAGASCTITLQLAASSSSASDGSVYATWKIATREVALTGYTQAAALTVSAAHLGFGTVFAAGLRSPRYLYVSNGSDAQQTHSPVVLSPSLPFQVTDGCPTTLAPRSVCQIAVTYSSSAVPSSDAATVTVDGAAVLIDGQTIPQPGVSGASVNPNLTVSPTAVAFQQAAVVTTVSTEVQQVTVQNTGTAPFALATSVTGDFSASQCPPQLSGGASCAITLHFTPSDVGTRTGLLSVTAGSSSPAYVQLSGTATAFLPVDGVLAFGEVTVGSPQVQWFKVGQSFSSLTVASSSPAYGVLLVEDTGYGYGTPDRGAFSQSTTGSCLSCYLGVQFLPSAPGAALAQLTISSTSGGASQTLALTGTGVAATGVLLTPAVQNFGAVSVGSATGAQLFTLTNATDNTITTGQPVFTGDFGQSAATTGGTACGATLQVGESCTVAVQFAPTATGPRSGSIAITTSAATATSALSGYGDSSPGIAFAPASLFFRNVPDGTATVQTITVTNTGQIAATVGTPTATDSHFSASTNCAALAPGASCSITVNYAATASLASGVLTVPITTSPGGAAQTTNDTLVLNGLYTAENAGLQIVPGEESGVDFGALSTGVVSGPRVFRVNNLSGKPLTLTVQAPRQFPVTATSCGGLAPGGSCTVTLAYAPVLNAAATGTLFLQAQPTDGSATLDGLAYVQGYGNGTGTIAVTGSFTAAGVIDFGLVPSGQSATQTLVVANQSATQSVTVRRLRADFPFNATSTCGLALAPAATCTITLTYTPNAQTTPGGSTNAQSQTGLLTIESDAGNSPLLVDLAGRTTPTGSVGGNAVSPIATLTTSQGSLVFGAGMVGSGSAQQTVTVTNTGTVPLTITGTLTAPDFTATTNCGTLAVGASCQVGIRFTPQSAGTHSAALEIQSNAANALEFVTLLGMGTPASISLTPSSLLFGRVLVGSTSAPQMVTLTNTGASPVTVGAIGVSGDFVLVASGGASCQNGTVLAADSSCSIGLTFTPGATGTRNGLLTVSSSATQLPLSVSLSGIGVQPQLTVSPASLSFGDVLIGHTATLALTLANVSASAVNALQIAVSPGDFSVSPTCGPVTLAAGSSCSINVTFTPTAAGTRTGTLSVSSSDPASPLTVSLTGNGLVGGSFTLTADGAPGASATVATGIAASYALAVTPVNGFTGAVALTCAPQSIVAYSACSIVPSTVMLANGTVNATATITTVTAVSPAASLLPVFRHLRGIAVCLLPLVCCAGLRRDRRLRGMLLALLLSIFVLGAGGCGSGTVGDTRLRYAAPGVYQFTVTAASTTGITASQSVQLTLTVQGQ